MNVMTCREMEALLRDMSRPSQSMESQAMASETLTAAAAHLDGCPSCSAQLEREHRLTANLTALAGSIAASTGSAAAPAMEAHLRAEFREHWRDRKNRRPVLQLPARRRWLWVAGAAAMIVVSIGVMRLKPSGTPVESTAGATASLSHSGTGDPAPIPDTLGPGIQQPQRSTTTLGGIVMRTADGPLSAVAASASSVPAVSSPDGGPVTRDRPRQVGSGFVPLFYGGDPFLMEAGQVWRVEMPRAGLQSVGMPVVEESRAGRVQVDILLGEDGIARAIRLVQ